jgi:hypothetical protein
MSTTISANMTSRNGGVERVGARKTHVRFVIFGIAGTRGGSVFCGRGGFPEKALHLLGDRLGQEHLAQVGAGADHDACHSRSSATGSAVEGVDAAAPIIGHEDLDLADHVAPQTLLPPGPEAFVDVQVDPVDSTVPRGDIHSRSLPFSSTYAGKSPERHAPKNGSFLTR